MKRVVNQLAISQYCIFLSFQSRKWFECARAGINSRTITILGNECLKNAKMICEKELPMDWGGDLLAELAFPLTLAAWALARRKA